MGYATLRQVKDWITGPAGTCEDEALRTMVNDIRNEFYNWYERLPLFLDGIECFELQEFCRDCNACDTSYRGLTLPRHFQTVEALWTNDVPIPLNGEWRNWRTWDPRIRPETNSGLTKIDIPGRFPTERDMRSDKPRRLIVRAFKKSDVGKRVLIRGTDAFNRPYSQEIELAQSNTLTIEKLKSIEKIGGIVKDVTVGRVLLADEDGYNLSLYEPDETVPAYRRIEVTGIATCPEQVNVRAARQYFPLYDDDDIVETDNQQAFKNMAAYLRKHFQVQKVPQDIAVENNYLATAKALMLGQKARDTGRGTITEVMVASPGMPARAQLHR